MSDARRCRMTRHGHAAFLTIKPAWLHEAWAEVRAEAEEVAA